MGKIEAESNIDHFSHQAHHHPLKLISYQSSPTNKTTCCSACRKQASGLMYICESCNYCLHKPCANMPQTLTHEADKKHKLVLRSAPSYTNGSFQCNACGVVGTGFCYHCQDCQLDLHTVCAFMRSSVKGPAHEHPLELCFELPYEDKTFVCNVCGGSGSNHWVYRCDPCGFDAHLKCAKRPVVLQKLESKIQKNQQRQSTPTIHKLQQANDQVVKCKSVHNSIQIVCQQPLETESSRQLHRSHTAPVYPTPTQGLVYTAPVYPTPTQDLAYTAPVYPTPTQGLVYTAPVYPRQDFLHTTPVYPTPGFVPGPNRNNTVENIVQSVIEGLFEGGASQIAQVIIQSALGN